MEMGRDRGFRALWERWRGSSAPMGSSKNQNAQNGAGLDFEVSPTFQAMPGDRHFLPVTQPILKPVQNRWDGLWDRLTDGGGFPCLEQD